MEVNCVYTGADGKTRIGTVQLPIMHKVVGEDGVAAWQNVQVGRSWGVTGSDAHEAAKDFGPWHPAGHAMMSIVLQGAWEVETGSGERRLLELGSLTVFLDETGQGHRSRTTSSEPTYVIGVGLDEPTAHQFREQLGLV